MIDFFLLVQADQASIVGGAINFVKELEKLLQSLEAHKQIKKVISATGSDFSSPFSDFFTFPQYSTASSRNKHSNNSSSSTESIFADQKRDQKRSIAIADVEVTMIESHANLKIQSRKHPKQLLKMVTGLHSLGLHILHLNVTTVDQMALYSFSVKVEDECKLTSVDEIAAAVHEMVGRIQEDATSNCMPSVE
uniref:Plant bHLH transcription factor ACT-like domain-containing protein n=1 Tax=Populus trichocarpa TaxID=3694 RepID=A0A3N7FDN8_POPTR